MTTLTPPWTRLYQDIKIDLPGVSDPVIQQEIYRVLKDFVETTSIWQETVEITGMPNTTSYPFVLAGEGDPYRLLMLTDPLQSPPPAPRWVQSMVGMQVPGVIVIGYPPSSQVTWNAVIAKTLADEVTAANWPKIDADDNWIIDRYRAAFKFGTIANLQRQPSKPYTNPALAADNMRQYYTLRGRARADVLKQNAYGAQAWNFPQGFATVTRKGWV